MQTNLRGEFEQTLRRRRIHVLRQAAEREAALRAIAEERESEVEEAAQEEQLDRVLSRLDDRERHQITEINAALDRIAAGTYGRCIHCKAAIASDRLTVLPEATVCVRCAGALESAHATAAPGRPLSGTVPPDLALLDDGEMAALLRETVEADERIDHEELRISCRHGVVHLDGVLPSESEHVMLRRLVQDVLGLRDVIDRIRIDEAPWERADWSKAVARRSIGFEPAGTDDVVEGEEEGISLVPADRPPA